MRAVAVELTELFGTWLQRQPRASSPTAGSKARAYQRRVDTLITRAIPCCMCGAPCARCRVHVPVIKQDKTTAQSTAKVMRALAACEYSQ